MHKRSFEENYKEKYTKQPVSQNEQGTRQPNESRDSIFLYQSKFEHTIHHL